jgi:uncharacterized protein YoxC
MSHDESEAVLVGRVEHVGEWAMREQKRRKAAEHELAALKRRAEALKDEKRALEDEKRAWDEERRQLHAEYAAKAQAAREEQVAAHANDEAARKDLEKKLQHSERDAEEQRKRADEQSAELQVARKELCTRRTEQKLLEEQAADLLAEEVSAKVRIENMEQQLEAVRQEHAKEMEQQQTAWSKEREQQQSDAEEAKRALQELKRKNDGLRALHFELTRRAERANELEHENAQIQAKYAQEQTARHELKERLAQSEQEGTKKDKELGVANQKLGQLEKKASEKEGELEGMKERLREVEKEVVAQKQKVNQLEQVTSKLEEEKTALSDRTRGLEAEAQRWRPTLEEKEAEINGLKAKLDGTKTEADAQRKRGDELVKDQKDKEATIQALQHAQQKLEAKLQQVEQESGKRLDELAAAKEACKNKEEERVSISKRYDKKNAEYQKKKEVELRLQKQMTFLEGQNASLKEQLETAKREKETVQKEKEAIEIALAREKIALAREKEELNETIHVVQNKNEKWRKHVKELERRMQDAVQQGQTAAAPPTPPPPTLSVAQRSPESHASVQIPESQAPAVARRFTPPGARNFALRPELEDLSPIWEDQDSASKRQASGRVSSAPEEIRPDVKIRFSDMYCYQKGKKNKAGEPGRANAYPCDDAMAVDRSTLVVCDGVSQGGAGSGKLARQVAQTIIRLSAEDGNGDGQWREGGSGEGGGAAVSASPPHACTPPRAGSGQSYGLTRSQHLLLKASREEGVQQLYHQSGAHGRAGLCGPSTTATVVSLGSDAGGFSVESTEVSIW